MRDRVQGQLLSSNLIPTKVKWHFDGWRHLPAFAAGLTQDFLPVGCHRSILVLFCLWPKRCVHFLQAYPLKLLEEVIASHQTDPKGLAYSHWTSYSYKEKYIFFGQISRTPPLQIWAHGKNTRKIRLQSQVLPFGRMENSALFQVLRWSPYQQSFLPIHVTDSRVLEKVPG